MKRKRVIPVQPGSAADQTAVAKKSRQPVAPAPMQRAEEPAVTEDTLTRWELVEVVLFFIMVTLAIFVPTGRVSIILMLLCLIFTIRKSSLETLRQHLSLPVLGLVGMLILYGISGVVTPYGQGPVLEFFRGLCTFTVAGFALLRFRKKHVPALLWGFVIVMAVMAFITIDGGSTGVLYNAVTKLCGFLEADMSDIQPVLDARLNSIFNNSNASAGMLGMSMLVGLYQVTTQQDKKKRFAASMLLGVSAVAFWLHLSRGAILCFGVSLLVYLLLTKKGDRFRLFLLMLISAGSTMTLASAAFLALGTNSVLPDLMALLCGCVIFLLDSLLTERVLHLLVGKEKAIRICAGALAGACLILVAAVFLVTGPFTLQEGMPLMREVDLTPGASYTISGDWDGDPTLNVYVESRNGLFLDQYEYLYTGSLKEAEFTIPEDTAVTHIEVSGNGEELRALTLSDGTKITLDYQLLPYSMEKRLQDSMLTSSSFLLRVQYVKDALKLWAKSPIFGRGLASTDTLYPSVQPFYYESQFVHNHLVQYLVDLGLVGLSCFLLIVAGVVWLLLRKRKEDPLAVMFLAAMTMMQLHSLMEINFSVRAFAVMAYLLMAIMVIAFGKPLSLKGREAGQKTVCATAAGFWLLLAALSCVSISYHVVLYLANGYQTTDYATYMSTLEKVIEYNALDDSYYKVLYLAQGTGVPGYEKKTRQYAQDLRASGTFTNCDAAARYYYLPTGQLGEVFSCTLAGVTQKASDAEAWNGELDFYRATVLTTIAQDWAYAEKSFLGGVENYIETLTAYNEGRIQPIELTEDNQAFVSAVLTLQDADMTAEESYALLSQYTYAESEA